MNPLLKGAEQVRYYSPIYEPIYDEEDNVIDEECVRNGTNVLETFIKPVHNDGKPRYYRLRYPVHAKEHKRRWVQWVDNQLGNVEAFNVKVTKIGRRVLFSSDPNFQAKREKRLRRIQAARSLAARPEDTWDPRSQPFVETDEEYTQRVETNELNYHTLDRLLGETSEGETIYECAESGDRYEER